MRIRTLTSLAALFMGLTVLGCETADDTDLMDDTTTEEPAVQDDMDDGMMDDTMDETMEDTTADTTGADADTAMAEDEGEMIEE